MSKSQSWPASIPREPTALLRWLLDPLILTARDSPFLLLLTALLVFVVWGGFASFGVPYLFWHDAPWMQFAAAISTALVCWELAFIGYLLASRDELWSQQNPVEGWLVRTALPLCLILGLAPLGRIQPDRWVPFELGLVLGTVIVLGLRWVVRYGLQDGLILDRLLARLLSHWVKLPQPEHRLQAVYFALMSVFYLSWTALGWIQLRPLLPAAVALCLAEGLVAALYGVVRFNFDRNRVFIYAAALLLFAGVQYLTFGARHRLDGLDYAAPVELTATDQTTTQRARLLDQTEVLDAWRTQAQAQSPGRKPKLAVVAVSGGGLRAATWSMSMLVELELAIDRFPYHVRAVTGASGGMLAAAHWVATLESPESAQAHGDHSLIDEISQTTLDRVAVHLALPIPGDRGVELEREFERVSQGALAVGLRQLRADEAAGWRPTLLFSPVLVEDGRAMLFSNVDASGLTRSDPWLESDAACSGPEPCTHSVTALEFFRLFPDADPRLSTITRLSASFPYVSPPVQLATRPPRRLVDAGYTDPFGVDLAARWIAHNRAWLREHTSGVVLIQIRDTADPRREIGQESARPWFERALAGIVAPGEAVLASRRTSTSFRNDNLTATLAALFEDADSELPFFTTVAFELDAQASLSWALTEAERERIRASVKSDANQDSLAWLRLWWHRG